MCMQVHMYVRTVGRWVGGYVSMLVVIGYSNGQKVMPRGLLIVAESVGLLIMICGWL